MTDRHGTRPIAGAADRASRRRAAGRACRPVPRRRRDGRDQGLRTAGPRRSCATTDGPAAAAAVVHAECVRGGARAAVAGAPRRDVGRSARRLRLGARPSISTSGCANAATGAAGDADQAEIAPARRRGARACPRERTLQLSTGIIGTRLPLDRVAAGVAPLVAGRPAADDAALEAVAEALRTTDSRDQARDDDRRAAGRRRRGGARSRSAASPRASA